MRTRERIPNLLTTPDWARDAETVFGVSLEEERREVRIQEAAELLAEAMDRVLEDDEDLEEACKRAFDEEYLLVTGWHDYAAAMKDVKEAEKEASEAKAVARSVIQELREVFLEANRSHNPRTKHSPPKERLLRVMERLQEMFDRYQQRGL